MKTIEDVETIKVERTEVKVTYSRLQITLKDGRELSLWVEDYQDWEERLKRFLNSIDKRLMV